MSKVKVKTEKQTIIAVEDIMDRLQGGEIDREDASAYASLLRAKAYTMREYRKRKREEAFQEEGDGRA